MSRTTSRSVSRYRQSQEHIRSYYGLDLKRGTPVVFEGMPGRVSGFRGSNILVRLDDASPGARPLNCHPRWRMAYPTLGIEAEE